MYVYSISFRNLSMGYALQNMLCFGSHAFLNTFSTHVQDTAQHSYAAAMSSFINTHFNFNSSGREVTFSQRCCCG